MIRSLDSMLLYIAGTALICDASCVYNTCVNSADKQAGVA